MISGLQKVSLIDYPGKVAAVVFTRGCPLRCHYCHNPQLVLPEMFAPLISKDRVMNFLQTRKGSLEGVVVTGGEPMVHSDISQFLGEIKREGYAIKLDTSGMFPDALKTVISDGLVDYVAMDVKAPFDRYSEVAGILVDQKAIKRSIEIIKDSGIDYEFRTTVVKGQLSEDDIVSIAESIVDSKKYVLQRFRSGSLLDQTFGLKGTYSDKEFERIKERAGKYVHKCEVR